MLLSRCDTHILNVILILRHIHSDQISQLKHSLLQRHISIQYFLNLHPMPFIFRIQILIPQSCHNGHRLFKGIHHVSQLLHSCRIGWEVPLASHHYFRVFFRFLRDEGGVDFSERRENPAVHLRLPLRHRSPKGISEISGQLRTLDVFELIDVHVQGLLPVLILETLSEIVLGLYF